MRDRALALLLAVCGVLLLVATIGSTPVGHESATLNAEASVTGFSASNETITAFTVTVTNTGNEPIQPVFYVWSENWSVTNSWPITKGPDVLEPGETARYRIVSPGDLAEPQLTDKYLIRIGDAGEQSWTTIGPQTLQWFAW